MFAISDNVNWTISNTTINTSNTNAHGLYSIYGFNLTLQNISVTARGSGARGAYLYISNNITIRDSYLNSALSYDIEMRLDNAARRAYLINTTINPANVFFTDASAGYLDRGWYVDFYVNDTAVVLLVVLMFLGMMRVLSVVILLLVVLFCTNASGLSV
jgi:hypothetical protein